MQPVDFPIGNWRTTAGIIVGERMNLVEFAEKISPVPLSDWQKRFLSAYEQAREEGKVIIFPK